MITEKMRGIGAALLVLGTSGFDAVIGSEVADLAMQGNRVVLQMLLKGGEDVNTPQADGATALHWAAHNDDLELINLLLEAGANVSTKNRAGVTPLSLACSSGNTAVVELLLNAGANPNEALPNGETVLMMAARTGSVDTLNLLIDRGAEVNARENLRETTPLMWAVDYGNPPAVQTLIDRGADISARSKAVLQGRRPYLAPTPKERIDEAERGLLVGESRRERPRELTGGLTALVFAARRGDLESAQILIAAGTDVNQVTEYGWTALLAATQNRYYLLGKFLLNNGADPSIANKGGWTPLYIATDNRNIESGDYPTRRADMDHLQYIELLLEHGADPNARMKSSTETRTIFTHQWLREDGATPFLRAAQSSDTSLMQLLIQSGADPLVATANGTTPLMVASGIGWVEGVTYEWSEEQNIDTINWLLELGTDVNAVDRDGRSALHGAAHKGRNEVVQILADHGANLAHRDLGSRDSIHNLSGVTWQALDYADGLVRVGVQSSIAHSGTAALIRELMADAGLPVPPEGRTLESICVTDLCR